MALAGVGAIMVGAFPENTVGILHGVGAGIAIVAGNLGILILGLVLTRLPEGLRTFMRLFSVLSLVAAVCFASSQFFGLGKGTMERVAAYPMTVWLIVFGMYISRTHRASQAASARVVPDPVVDQSTAKPPRDAGGHDRRDSKTTGNGPVLPDPTPAK
jgi:hypothetical protein